MAEIVLKIGTVGLDPKYQDGDIIDVFNKPRIEWDYLENTICKVINEPFNSDGLRPANCMACFHQSKRYQYKNVRISNLEYERTNILTGEKVIISNVPIFKCPVHAVWTELLEQNVVIGQKITNKFQCPTDNLIWYRGGEQTKVSTWLFMRINKWDSVLKKWILNTNHRIFGTKGNEYWYGGHTDYSDSCRETIWTEVEERGKAVRANCQKWRFSQDEMKYKLIVPCDEFDEIERTNLVKSVEDLTDPRIPILLKKRKHFCNWETDLDGISAGTIAKIKDGNIPMDLRKFAPYTRATIIKVKS